MTDKEKKLLLIAWECSDEVIKSDESKAEAKMILDSYGISEKSRFGFAVNGFVWGFKMGLAMLEVAQGTYTEESKNEEC